MESKTGPVFLEAGLHIGYMVYHATGEGVRVCVGAAGSAQEAEHLLKEKLPTYFHNLIVTASVDADANDDARKMIEWIAEPAKTILAQIPRGTGEYYAELYYNLA